MKYEIVLDNAKCDRCKAIVNYAVLNTRTKEMCCPSCLSAKEIVELRWEVDNLKKI